MCWHHKDNKLLSIYRNILSKDGLVVQRQKEAGNSKALSRIFCLPLRFVLPYHLSVLNGMRGNAAWFLTLPSWKLR